MRYRLVGGKGGVGKTTCAAAIALAEALRGFRTLVLSTDPAPSLGDVFQVRLGRAPKVVPVKGGRLDALELDVGPVMQRWLRDRRPALEEIALRGTWLDRDDVQRLLGLTLPGLDEIAALLELVRLGRQGTWDVIVVDTAPTGHTLRMIGLPGTFEGVAGAFDHMQEKHRLMVEAIRGAWPGDRADDLIAEMYRDASQLRELFTDPDRLHVSWVALPEPVVVEETVDGVKALRAGGVPVQRVIVNRVLRAASHCSWCRARRSFEAVTIASLRASLRSLDPASVPTIHVVTDREHEPVGLRALAGIVKEIERTGALPARRSTRTVRPVLSSAISGIGRRYPLERYPAVRLAVFGGKGGVGKTTCAAAAALAAARSQPRRRILLLSTDPAHSLADVLGIRLSDEPVAVPGSPFLFARELDAPATFARVRARYNDTLDRLFDGISQRMSMEAAHDRQIMHDLLTLSPPGLDEVMAAVQIAGLLEKDSASAFDLIVMDAAPTGHALKLLEMPALVQDWTKALMSILLKYQGVVGLGEFGALLLQLSRGLGALRALLRDPERTHFIVVTRAGTLPAAETRRLLNRLATLAIHVPAVVVNAVGHGTCARCTRVSRDHLSELGRARRLRPGDNELIVTPGRVPPPRGAAALLSWRGTWRAV